MVEQQTLLPKDVVEQVMGGKFEKYVPQNPDSTARVARKDVFVEVMPVGVNQFWRVSRLGPINKAEIRDIGLLNPTIEEDSGRGRVILSTRDHEVVIFSGVGSYIRSK